MKRCVIVVEPQSLAHHGIKGMKWGVWNEDTEKRYYSGPGRTKWGVKDPNGFSNKGGVLKKGTVVYRTSTHPKDPVSGNRLYVSTSREANKNWRDYMAFVYKKGAYKVKYKTADDVRVMPAEELGKFYVDKMLHDKAFKKQSLKDLSTVWNEKITDKDKRAYYPDEHFFYATKTSGKLFDEARKRGYQAIGDRKGQWLDRDPLIVMDPHTNLIKKSTTPEFSNLARGKNYSDAERWAKYYGLQVKQKSTNRI